MNQLRLQLHTTCCITAGSQCLLHRSHLLAVHLLLFQASPGHPGPGSIGKFVVFKVGGAKQSAGLSPWKWHVGTPTYQSTIINKEDFETPKMGFPNEDMGSRIGAHAKWLSALAARLGGTVYIYIYIYVYV